MKPNAFQVFLLTVATAIGIALAGFVPAAAAALLGGLSTVAAATAQGLAIGAAWLRANSEDDRDRLYFGIVTLLALALLTWYAVAFWASIPILVKVALILTGIGVALYAAFVVEAALDDGDAA